MSRSYRLCFPKESSRSRLGCRWNTIEIQRQHPSVVSKWKRNNQYDKEYVEADTAAKAM